jgi:hypothetical protein
MPRAYAKYEEFAGGSGRAVTPYSLSKNAGLRQKSRMISLGTGAVSTRTDLVGRLPTGGCKVVGIYFTGTDAVTGTGLTAEVKKLSADGNTATTLQASAVDLKLTASTDEVPQAATLTAATTDLTLASGAVLQVVFTASSITAGPGDVEVLVEYVPVEDARQTDRSYQRVRDLL